MSTKNYSLRRKFRKKKKFLKEKKFLEKKFLMKRYFTSKKILPTKLSCLRIHCTTYLDIYLRLTQIIISNYPKTNIFDTINKFQLSCQDQLTLRVNLTFNHVRLIINTIKKPTRPTYLIIYSDRVVNLTDQPHQQNFLLCNQQKDRKRSKSRVDTEEPILVQTYDYLDPNYFRHKNFLDRFL